MALARVGPLAALLALLLVAPAHAFTVPEGFDVRQLADRVYTPTAAAVAPDGRVFVAEKSGRVRVAGPGDARARLLIDLSHEVNSYSDRGMLGLALDPQFAANGRIYLLYVVDPSGYDLPVATESRLTRIEVDADNRVLGPEHVILGGIPAETNWHLIGTVRAADDGTFWVGTGDATSDGHARALGALDPHSLRGKVLHVDADGRGLPGHPFCPAETDLAKACTKVYAGGFRNPFRFHVLPDGDLVVGDVGLGRWEELGRVRAGEMHGWPCYEGWEPGASIYRSVSPCPSWYSAATRPASAAWPQHVYAHAGGAAVVAGPRYAGSSFPEPYRDAIFFGDYAKRLVRYLRPDGTVDTFSPDWLGVQLDPDATGEDLISVNFDEGSLGAGSVWRVTWSPGDRAPVARIAATPPQGDAPLTTVLSAAESSDPDGGPLTYRWDFGDGSPEAAGAVVEHTYAQRGRYLVELTVEDASGRRAQRAAAVQAGNAPQVALSGDSDFRPGRAVAVDVAATDREDGALGGEAIAWEVDLYHVDHVHPYTSGSGSRIRFTADPAHAQDGRYEVRVRATDSDGLETRAQRRITYAPPAPPPPGGSGPGTAPQPEPRAPELTLARRRRALKGRVRSASLPVRVRVGLRRHCRWWRGAKLTRQRRCRRPVWLDAAVSDDRWRFPLPRALPAGRWHVRARALDATGARATARLRTRLP